MQGLGSGAGRHWFLFCSPELAPLANSGASGLASLLCVGGRHKDEAARSPDYDRT